jgi:hypothetical protein
VNLIGHGDEQAGENLAGKKEREYRQKQVAVELTSARKSHRNYYSGYAHPPHKESKISWAIPPEDHGILRPIVEERGDEPQHQSRDG